MPAKFFDHQGLCLIGSNTKGKHWSEISESWCQWACKEIEGFKYQYLIAKNKPKPELISSFEPTGRTYLIKRKQK
jgi:hypothetical protein